MKSRTLCAALFGLIGHGGAVSAATLIWPATSGVCSTTLQACIDSAASGDRIDIGREPASPDSYTAIDENLLIRRSISIEPVNGVDAVFGDGRGITVSTLDEPGAASVTLRRLVLRNGNIVFNHRSGGTGTYTADDLRFTFRDVGFANRCPIEFLDVSTFPSSANFIATRNTLTFEGGVNPSCGIRAIGQGDGWRVNISDNRILETAPSLSRGIEVIGENFGDVDIRGNQIDGVSFDSGIYVEERAGTGSHFLSVESNSIHGQDGGVGGLAPVDNGIAIIPGNAEMFITNNTVVRGANGVRIFAPLASVGTSTGRVANNLIAFNSARGLSIGQDTVSNNNNLVFANGFNSFTPGAGTVTAEPRLRGFRDPRLSAFSPAINAGNTSHLVAGFNPFDADGEIRFVGSVDIGAFERNRDEAVRTVTTPSTVVQNQAALGFSNAIFELNVIQTTPLHDAVHGNELANNLGVFLSSSFGPEDIWTAYHENIASMSTGRGFASFYAFDGRPAFIHRTTIASVSENSTRLDHPALNSQPGAIAFVTHRYDSASVSGAYHDHRTGVAYFGNSWFIDNQNIDVAIPADRLFHVTVAPPNSPNAFVRALTSPVSMLRLEHPLLDDNPCAALIVTRNARLSSPVANNNVAFTTEYVAGTQGAPGHWFVRAEGPGAPTFPFNAGFNVMVYGPQANACRNDGVIFADGFEE